LTNKNKYTIVVRILYKALLIVKETKITLIILLALSHLFFLSVNAEEIIIRETELPFASMTQEIIYSTSQKQYDLERDFILKKLRERDFSVMQNPSGGSTKIVQTTAMIGISWKGVGTSEGRKHLRKITAAEEALFLFEND
jgi:hypothetical protein